MWEVQVEDGGTVRGREVQRGDPRVPPDYGRGQKGPGGEGRDGEHCVRGVTGVPEGRVRLRVVRVVEQDPHGSSNFRLLFGSGAASDWLVARTDQGRQHTN